jgi:queuine tRNA-ribosyltransferase
MADPFFQIESRCGNARAGRLRTAHGEVETPVFMPVGTLATVKGVPQDILEDLGVEILLSNTYHLFLRPGTAAIREIGGLHRFMAWERPILTDSGGYQVFSLSDLRKVAESGVEFRSHLDGALHVLTPETATAAQIDLGADIIMAFDECTEYPAQPARARESMEMTLRWAGRCKQYFEDHKGEVPWDVSRFAFRVSRTDTSARDSGFDGRHPAGNSGVPTGMPEPDTRNPKPETRKLQSLFGIVQGGMDANLRRESAARTVEFDFPGYAMGGLSVGEPRALTQTMVAATLPELPWDRPRYLMGVGTPEEIVEYAAMGVDMMDCVLPTRAARHGLLFTSEGKLAIKQARFARDEGPIDPGCGCRVCARYSRAYLRHLFASNESLAGLLNTVHNLSFYLDTMRAVRHSIKLGRLENFVSELRSQRLNFPVQFPGEGPA